MPSRQFDVLRMIREERDLNRDPVIHPNGFIQLWMHDGRRMHFWHPEIPRQKVASPIHDHIFDMWSEVLLGRLVHTEVETILDSDGYYNVWVVRSTRDSETVLENTGRRVRAEYKPSQILMAGDHYAFPAESFHVTRDSNPCVSIITKGKTYPGSPRVLVPYGTEPDNEFERDAFEPFELEQWMTRVVVEAGAL